MIKFLTGIILVQAGTCALLYAGFRGGVDNTQLMLTLGLLDILFCVLAGFWFSAMARRQYREALEALKEQHAREREELRVHAERQKARVVSKSQKQLLRETRRAHAAANLKVGVSFAVALAFGILMLSTQFITFGLLVLTTTGGGLIGWLARGKQLAVSGKKTRLPEKTG